ncbi:hypothetical protein DFH09DRAFT_1374139 [Mycena vulgaris]|nr:hypothetical protein DFH09DRAFT_1374139 [Mycena vulgaris]
MHVVAAFIAPAAAPAVIPRSLVSLLLLLAARAVLAPPLNLPCAMPVRPLAIGSRRGCRCAIKAARMIIPPVHTSPVFFAHLTERSSSVSPRARCLPPYSPARRKSLPRARIDGPAPGDVDNRWGLFLPARCSHRGPDSAQSSSPKTTGWRVRRLQKVFRLLARDSAAPPACVTLDLVCNSSR